MDLVAVKNMVKAKTATHYEAYRLVIVHGMDNNYLVGTRGRGALFGLNVLSTILAMSRENGVEVTGEVGNDVWCHLL